MYRIIFAYGSNMSSARLKARVPSARKLGRGALHQHRLRFHKRGADGSAKANAFYTGDTADIVHGVLFEIDENELQDLDRAEPGYERSSLNIDVVSGAGPSSADVYRAKPESIVETLLPFDWYLQLVITGAHEHGLPDDYCTQLQSIKSTPDRQRENMGRKKKEV